MKRKQIFYFLVVILMIGYGCKKDSDTSGDLTAGKSGSYVGSMTLVGTGTVAATCKVVKVSNTTVNLEMTVAGETIPTLPSVTLSDAGSGKINLSYTDSSGSLNGSIVNNTLTFTLQAGTIQENFSGTKQ